MWWVFKPLHTRFVDPPAYSPTTTLPPTHLGTLHQHWEWPPPPPPIQRGNMHLAALFIHGTVLYGTLPGSLSSTQHPTLLTKAPSLPLAASQSSPDTGGGRVCRPACSSSSIATPRAPLSQPPKKSKRASQRADRSVQVRMEGTRENQHPAPSCHKFTREATPPLPVGYGKYHGL